MDAKPMTPADLVTRLRRYAEPPSSVKVRDALDVEAWKAADCLEAQAAEITALRAERDALSNKLDVTAKLYMDDTGAYQSKLTAALAERDAFLAVLEGAEYRDLETVATYTPAQARQLGEFAKASTLGVLAERDALAARLAVPGKEWLDELVRGLSRVGIFEPLGSDGAQAARALTALRARVAGLEGALEPFAGISDLIDSETEGLEPTDELELHFLVYLMAKFTVAQFRSARAALSPSAQEARDAE